MGEYITGSFAKRHPWGEQVLEPYTPIQEAAWKAYADDLDKEFWVPDLGPLEHVGLYVPGSKERIELEV